MKITVQTEGGVAFMPGLARPISVDTDALAPETRRSLAELVDKAQFFTLLPQPEPIGKARDLQLHRITIATPDGRSHTVRRHDPLPPPLAAIIAAVRGAARTPRSG